jgi:hypothetical protein
VAGGRPINFVKLSTITAVAILVGTEVVGASWAAGWAIGGMMQLPHAISRGLEVVFALFGFVMLFYFMRVALRHEPIRD